MRITTVFIIIACIAAICLAGCAGQADLLPANSIETQASPWDGYDPFAPAVEFTPTKAALASATGIDAGGFNVVALDKQNQVDYRVQEALVLDATPESLVISLKAPVPYAGLYISYDGAAMHAISFDTNRPDGIGMAVESEPGLVAVGVCAFADGQLDSDYPLVRISFDAGASIVQKRLSVISQQDTLAVRDLEAVDGGEEAATLGWSERNTGDYDLNSEVNLADISKIAIHYQKGYTEESADFAILEVVDGDENLEVNLADLTQIAINYLSTISGYNVYRTPLGDIEDVPPAVGDAAWVLIPNASEPGEPTIKRADSSQDYRFRYTYLDATGDGPFAWYVTPVGPVGSPREEGQPSNFAQVQVTGGEPPEAGLSFEIMFPHGPLMNLDDEFYVGVKITDVVDLFSANVRFEYDGSLIEFVEAVDAYETNVNLLYPPLFLAADDIGAASSPYVLLGFNATQTQGTDVKGGTGFLGFFKFKVIDAATNTEALRFPAGSIFFHLWGDQYGVPIATPALGGPQVINAGV